MKLFLIIIFSLVLIGCVANIDCCQECLEQSNQDPSGYDISIKPCAEYSLSDSCHNFDKLVMECR